MSCTSYNCKCAKRAQQSSNRLVCIVRVITVSVRSALNNRERGLYLFTSNNRKCAKPTQQLCVLYEHLIEKTLSGEKHKPLTMGPNRFWGICILSFAYSKYKPVPLLLLVQYIPDCKSVVGRRPQTINDTTQWFAWKHLNYLLICILKARSLALFVCFDIALCASVTHVPDSGRMVGGSTLSSTE